MMTDRMSSEPSKRPSSGEARVDLASWGVDDLSDRVWGDADLMGSSEVAGGSEGVDETLDSTRSGSKDGDDSCCSEYLALEATRGMAGEKDGGGLTGGASPGDVMDTEWIQSVVGKCGRP